MKLLPAGLRLAPFVAFLPLLGGSSCGSRFECDSTTPCPFGETCEAGFCVTPGCSTSQQCPIDHYCAANRECVPGCQSSFDCRTGYQCDPDALECVEEACQDAAIDCGFKEFCNTATGECYDAGGTYCNPCRSSTEEADCGAGNECYAGYCLRDCSDGQECPSGFECYAFTNGLGQIVTYQCLTYCWLYEDYEPGSFAAPPRVDGPIPLDSDPRDLFRREAP